MFGLGATELVIILVILVMIFGLGKLPKVAGQLGNSMKAFRDSVEGKDEEIEIGDDESRPAKLEDKQADQAGRDASVPQPQETSERRADGL